MKIKGLREKIERYIGQPVEQMGRGARFLRGQVMLWTHCAKRLHEHDVMVLAAALAYRTIFAMIPVMVLALLFAQTLGVVEDGKQSLQQFLHASGFDQIVAVHREEAPDDANDDEPVARQINVAEQIELVVDRVQDKLTFARIGPVGGLVLIWTASMLMASMESALNRIFAAPHGRSPVHRILVYWSGMTLGPVLLAAASYLGRQSFAAFERIGGAFGILLVLVGWLSPTLMTILVVAAVYKLLPNKRVSFRLAIGGATVATLIWVIAREAFALYVDRLVLQGNIYGVLGVLPLFFLWLYCSWLIFLFGAELAHTAAHLKELERAEQELDIVLGPSDMLAAALTVTEAYLAGQGPISLEEVSEKLGIPSGAVQDLLDRLVDKELLVTVDQESSHTHYVPARPPDRISVQSVLDIADPAAMPDSPRIQNGSVGRALADVLGRTQAALDSMTLATILDKPQT